MPSRPNNMPTNEHTMQPNTPQAGTLRQAWLVIVLGLLYGGALAGVQTSLGPRIEANKRAETYRAIPQIVPGADPAQTAELTVTGRDGRPGRAYQARNSHGELAGWVLPATGLGFADRIDLLVALDPELSTITGMYVIDQKETPGLGNFISADRFRDEFRGKSADEPLRIVKDDPKPAQNEIRTLSGATISSESVAGIVNDAIDNLRGPLRAVRP